MLIRENGSFFYAGHEKHFLLIVGAVVGSACGVARHDLVLLDRGLELFFIFLVFRVRGQLLI